MAKGRKEDLSCKEATSGLSLVSRLLIGTGVHLMNPGRNLTKSDLIIEVWERLDCESVGAEELRAIQKVVSDRFGAGAVESPSIIARLLADEGAVLRHPEVIDYDAAWRERKLSDSLLPAANNVDDLAEAAAAINAIDAKRQELEAESRTLDLLHLRQAVLALREDRLLLAGSKVVKERPRLTAGEIAEWLRVWLESPDLFADWLELRQRSAEFRERFGEQV